jgi:hypothetical protein
MKHGMVAVRVRAHASTSDARIPSRRFSLEVTGSIPYTSNVLTQILKFKQYFIYKKFIYMIIDKY